MQDLTWLSQNQLEFRKWNKEANWSVQICRLDCSKRLDNLIQDVFVVLCPEMRTVVWYSVAASVGSAGGDAQSQPGRNFGKLSWARFVTKEMCGFVFAC